MCPVVDSLSKDGAVPDFWLSMEVEFLAFYCFIFLNNSFSLLFLFLSILCDFMKFYFARI